MILNQTSCPQRLTRTLRGTKMPEIPHLDKKSGLRIRAPWCLLLDCPLSFVDGIPGRRGSRNIESVEHTTALPPTCLPRRKSTSRSPMLLLSLYHKRERKQSKHFEKAHLEILRQDSQNYVSIVWEWFLQRARGPPSREDER